MSDSTQRSNLSILGKRKYKIAMGYENDAPPKIQEQNLAIKYATIPIFPETLFHTSTGLQEILEWFDGYHEYMLYAYASLYPHNQ